MYAPQVDGEVTLQGPKLSKPAMVNRLLAATDGSHLVCQISLLVVFSRVLVGSLKLTKKSTISCPMGPALPDPIFTFRPSTINSGINFVIPVLSSVPECSAVITHSSAALVFAFDASITVQVLPLTSATC